MGIYRNKAGQAGGLWAAGVVVAVLASLAAGAAEPNAPAGAKVAAPDRMELACGVAINVRVQTVKFVQPAGATQWRREKMSGLSLATDSNDSDVLVTADGVHLQGRLSEICVLSQGGVMTFKRNELRSASLDVRGNTPETAAPAALLEANRRRGTASVKKLQAAQKEVLQTIEDKYARLSATAEASLAARKATFEKEHVEYSKWLKEQMAAYGGDVVAMQKSEAEAAKSENRQPRQKVMANLHGEVRMAQLSRDWLNVLHDEEIASQEAAFPQAIKGVRAVVTMQSFVLQSGGGLSAEQIEKGHAAACEAVIERWVKAARKEPDWQMTVADQDRERRDMKNWGPEKAKLMARKWQMKDGRFDWTVQEDDVVKEKNEKKKAGPRLR